MTIPCFYTFTVACFACVESSALSVCSVYLLLNREVHAHSEICCSPKIDVLFVDIMFALLHALYFSAFGT